MAKRVGRCLLTDLLDEANMTQQELADKLKVPKQQINKYTKNKTVMSYGTAREVAEILKVSMEELYEWKTSKR